VSARSPSFMTAAMPSSRLLWTLSASAPVLLCRDRFTSCATTPDRSTCSVSLHGGLRAPPMPPSHSCGSTLPEHSRFTSLPAQDGPAHPSSSGVSSGSSGSSNAPHL
jgi:hypothetical protein